MRVQLRHYAIKLVRPSSSTGGGDSAAAATAAFGDPSGGAAAAAAGPAVALSELGPRLDLVSNRAQWASDDLRRTACKGPRHAGTPRKTKNVSYDADGLGDTVGRLHVERQNLGALALTRTKALGNRRRNANWREGGGGDDDDDEGGAPDVEGGGGGGVMTTMTAAGVTATTTRQQQRGGRSGRRTPLRGGGWTLWTTRRPRSARRSPVAHVCICCVYLAHLRRVGAEGGCRARVNRTAAAAHPPRLAWRSTGGHRAYEQQIGKKKKTRRAREARLPTSPGAPASPPRYDHHVTTPLGNGPPRTKNRQKNEQKQSRACHHHPIAHAAAGGGSKWAYTPPP